MEKSTAFRSKIIRVILAISMGVWCTMIQGIEAGVSIDSPAQMSKIDRGSVLRGNCSGKSSVLIRGPGIDKNKKISCQEKSNSLNYWEYSLKNVYKKIPLGTLTIEVSQNGSSANRRFINGASGLPSVSPLPQASASPAPQASASPSPTVSPKPSVAPILSPSPTPSASPATSPKPSPIPVETNNLELDANKAPGENFDLKLWKLTLPVDSNGRFDGNAMEIKPLAAKYESEPYFYTGADGAMVFMAPVKGATTSGSHYPRSELREMNSDGSNAAWTIDQGGSLSATLSVNELPQTSIGAGRVVIGQIHGPDDELCRLYYDNGRLYFYDDKAGSPAKETQFILRSSTGAQPNIPLNAKFSYSISVQNNFLTVTAVYDSIVYSAIDAIGSFWPGKKLYFKAGIYVQVGDVGSGAGTTGFGSGKVSFYKLIPPKHP